MNDLITVIIPVYNCEKYLKNTFEVIKNQTYKNCEYIMIDDKSTDNSLEMLMSFKNSNIDLDVKVLSLDKNFGVGLARNAGLEIARGRYISFFDADDSWSNDKLEKQIKFMKEKNIGFCVTDYIMCYENGRRKLIKIPKVITYNLLIKNTLIHTSSVVFDLNIVDKELIIMPDYKHGQDVAVWWRVLKNGYNAYSLPDPVSYYNKHRNSLSSNKFKNIPLLWKIYREHEGFGVLKTFYCFCFFAINAVLRRI